MSAEGDALRAALSAAANELQVRAAAERANPSAATIAAVRALEDRVAELQSQIAALNEADVRPVAVTSPTGVSTSSPTPISPIPVTLTPVAQPTSPPINPTGGVGTVPEGPPAPVLGEVPKPPAPIPPPPILITPPGGGIGGTGLGMTPEQIAAALSASLSGEDSTMAAFIDSNGATLGTQDGWNYLRDAVESVFTDIENSLSDISVSAFESGTAITLAEVGAGVTADLASVDVVGFAGGILIASWCIGWVIAQLGAMFPDPSIFGWHPFGFIKSGIINFGNQFKQLATDGSKPIVDLFMQPVRQVMGLFQRSTNATASAHNKVARVVTHTVPDAIQTATDAAAKNTTAQIALITDAATQAVTMLTPTPTLEEAKRIITEALSHPTLVWQFEALAATAIISADTYADELHTLVQGDITAGVNASKQAALDAVTTFERTLIPRIVGDETLLSALTTTVNSTVPVEIESAVNSAIATQAARDSATTAALQSQIDALDAQISTLSARVTAAELVVSTNEAQILALQSAPNPDAQAIRTLESQITAARVDIATSTTAISDLYTQITGISNTLGPVQAAQQLNTAQLAPFETIGAVMLPTAIATLSSILNQVKTKVDTCVVENCDTTNPNNIRNVLKDLLGLLTAGAEIGFIAEAVRDPMGVANAMAPILDGIDAGAVDTLNALLSL